MKRVFRSHISTAVLSILPATRCFGFKRAVFRYLGYDVGADAKINGDIKIFGRGELQIGKGTWLGLRATFYLGEIDGVRLGENCDIGPDVLFVCGTHEEGDSMRRAGVGVCKPIAIGSGCWIGARCTILGDVSIGSGTVVGAGSVVLPGSYPANVLLAGVPARVLRVLP